MSAFFRGLQEQGFAVEQNVIIDNKYSKGNPDSFPRLAAELVTSKADLIVAMDSPAIRAAAQATSKIPIVIVSALDPVIEELVASSARPGGNITGVSMFRTGLNGKLLELLAETVPSATRLGALWASRSPGESVIEIEAAARALNIDLKILSVNGVEDIRKTFLGTSKYRITALVILPAVVFLYNATSISKIAIETRLSTIFWRSEFAEQGGLMAYGPNALDQIRRAGILAGKILRGSKPGDLPLERAMTFELVINLKTAKQIGVTIPPDVLARADRVIK
jgi:putative ABC transport system substrate-binding protein